MEIVEGCPRTAIYAEVAILETTPDVRTIGHTAHIADAPFGMILPIRRGTLGNLADHVLHTAAAFFIACGGIDSHCCQIMTSYVTVQSVPVRIGLGFGFQTSLFSEGCQQTIAVILQESLDVEVTGVLQWAVE